MRRIAFALTLSATTAAAQPQTVPSSPGAASPPTSPAVPPASVNPTNTQTPEQLKAASAQAKAGKMLLKQKDYAGARTLLESAYISAPTGGVLLDLVETYRGLALNALALQTVLRARTTGSPTLTAVEAKALDAHVAELSALTYRLQLTLPDGVSGLQLDGLSIEPPLPGMPLVLEPGLHALKVEKPNFEAYTKDLNAVAGQEAALVVELQAWVNTGQVRVSDKGGQQLNVFIDGIQVGTTPWQGDLPAGHHVIEGKNERAKAEPRSIDVPRRAVVDVVLDSVVHYERLIINSPVRGASATLDGQLIQLPYDQMVLVGEHQLRVTAPGHDTLEKTLNVEANKPVNEQVTLSGARMDEMDLERPKEPDPFRVGVLLGLVSIPRPINVEFSLKPNAFVGLGVGFSMLPEVTFEDVSSRMTAFNAVGRIFPFQGAFYLGLGAGLQNIVVEGEDTIDGDSYTGSVDHSAFFLTPQVGWLWVWDSGFALGMNVGVQIPITSTPDVRVRDARGQEIDPNDVGPGAVELRDDASDVAEYLGKLPLPAVDLLKIGFYF